MCDVAQNLCERGLLFVLKFGVFLEPLPNGTNKHIVIISEGQNDQRRFLGECAPTFELKMSEDQRHEWEPDFSHEFAQKTTFANLQITAFSAEPVAKIILGLKLKRPSPRDQSISSVGKIAIRIVQSTG